jgi:hypothetical protein
MEMLIILELKNKNQRKKLLGKRVVFICNYTTLSLYNYRIMK